MADDWKIVPLEYKPEELDFKAVRDYVEAKVASAFGLPATALEAPSEYGHSPIHAAAQLVFHQENLANNLADALLSNLVSSWDREIDRENRTCAVGHLHATYSGRAFCDLAGDIRMRLAPKG